MSVRHHGSEVPALLALFVGALAIGGSGIFVRLSETGPTATAFWRGTLALPALALWMLLERGRGAPQPGLLRSWRDPVFFWSGLFFAGDLAFWHAALMLTSIAASTLEANCAPIVVTLGAWALWGERPRPSFVLALLLATAGLAMIMSTKFGHGTAALSGDFLGLGAACFYGFYILAVSRLRARYRTGLVMFNSTLVFSLVLLPLALTQQFLPHTPRGWLLLLGCALSAQVAGQGLVAYALARLPATFGALGLYLHAMAATVYAWLLLDERLTPWQLAGGATILVAIALARAARRPAAGVPAGAVLSAARVEPVERLTP